MTSPTESYESAWCGPCAANVHRERRKGPPRPRAAGQCGGDVVVVRMTSRERFNNRGGEGADAYRAGRGYVQCVSCV